MYVRGAKVLAVAAFAVASALASGLDPIVPVFCRSLGVDTTCAEIQTINAETGLRRFYVCGPCFNDVMYGPLEFFIVEKGAE